MLPPTTRPLGGLALSGRIQALTGRLRNTYITAFSPAYDQAVEAGSRFEAPDGSGTLGPGYAADCVGCRAVTAILGAAVRQHFPGARLLRRLDESPTVIDSTWLYEDRVIAIEWDYTHDFGDPEGLTVREVIR